MKNHIQTKSLVTTTSWYERTDGTIGYYVWRHTALGPDGSGPRASRTYRRNACG